MQRSDFPYKNLLLEDITLLREFASTHRKEIQIKLTQNKHKKAKILNHALRQINLQIAKLEALKDSSLTPLFYTSIKTGVTVYNAPPNLHAVTAAATAKSTSIAHSAPVLFSYKNPRSPEKLMAKRENRQNVLPPNKSSTITQQHPDGTTGATLAIEHKEHRLDGGSKYPYGGTCTKVKYALNSATGEKRAIKTYSATDQQVKIRNRALRSKYFSERVLNQPSEVCSHAGQLAFITEWHEPIKLEEVRKLPVEQQVKYLLEIAHQAALFHQLNLLVIDLKADNFVYTQNGAKMIDLDSVIHLSELNSPDHSHILTTQYLDDEAILAQFSGQFNQYLNQHGKQLDVYLLGIAFAYILTSIKEFKLEARQNRQIADFVDMSYRQTDRQLLQGVTLTDKTGANTHPELNTFINQLTCASKERRPSDAIEVYQRLRQLVLDKKYLPEDQLPPATLPQVTAADSETIAKELVQINKQSKIDSLPAIVYCNNDKSFHINTPDNAVRYDYQTLKNIKMREKVLKLGPATVNKPVAVAPAPAKTSTSEDTDTIGTMETISVHERPASSHDSDDVIKLVIVDEKLNRLKDLFKKFVGHIIKTAPNIDSNHQKYKALKRFNDLVQNIKDNDAIDRDQLKQLAKTFFRLSLSHIHYDLFNTTDTGLRCRSELTNDYFKDLKNFLFPERNPLEPNISDHERSLRNKEGVRYRDIRKFVCGNEKNTKFFSRKNTKSILNNWQLSNASQQAATLEDLVAFKFG